jgi:hypothetical protein
VTHKDHKINHIALVLDASGSMGTLAPTVIKVADQIVEHLALQARSKDPELRNQETRVTVYTFNSTFECVVFDKDVLRLPSLKDHYNPGGQTALLDATDQAIDDLQKTAQIYGDHAFLIYVLTDGQENRSQRYSASHLSWTSLSVKAKPIGDFRLKLQQLPENWTMGCFVPDRDGKIMAEQFGFPTNNVAIWSTTDRGLEDAGEIIKQSVDAWTSNRAKGVRGSKNLFHMKVEKLDKNAVAKKLDALKPGQFHLLKVDSATEDKEWISTFVERKLRRNDKKYSYKIGSAFYQIVKKEKIGADKEIALYQRKGHTVWHGDNARKLLGLPRGDVKVAPQDHPDFEIFVQSKSVNRHMVKDQQILVLYGTV